jgi:hypothetical protein
MLQGCIAEDHDYDYEDEDDGCITAITRTKQQR